MIHELTHVWQYVQRRAGLHPRCDRRTTSEGYDYGGVDGLRAKKDAGQGFSAYNREQQGSIMGDYFDLRQDAREYEAMGQYAPATLREKLDVYIHFVKEVSTLSHQELDTPNPPLNISPTVFDTAPVLTATKSTGTPTSPVVGGVNGNTNVAWMPRSKSSHSQPTKKTPISSEQNEETTASKELVRPVSTRARDLALESLVVIEMVTIKK